MTDKQNGRLGVAEICMEEKSKTKYPNKSFIRQIIRVWFQKMGIKLSAVRFQKCVLKKTRCGFCENGFYDNSDRKAIQVPTFELTAS